MLEGLPAGAAHSLAVRGRCDLTLGRVGPGEAVG